MSTQMVPRVEIMKGSRVRSPMYGVEGKVEKVDGQWLHVKEDRALPWDGPVAWLTEHTEHIAWRCTFCDHLNLPEDLDCQDCGCDVRECHIISVPKN